MTETDELQKDIIKYLKLRGYPATRKQSGRVRSGKYWINQGEAGWQDCISVIPPNGRFLGVECKKPGEKLSDKQLERKAELEAAGALVIVATCLEDVINGLPPR